MVLECTIICVDNSEYMINEDFHPSRLQAQQDAVNLVCHSKCGSNPASEVGLLTLASNVEVIASLTNNLGLILSRLYRVTPKGYINLVTGVKIAQMALKHRQGKNHKLRIIIFIGSPVKNDEQEVIKLADCLKKDKINVDVVSFGEEAENHEILTTFVNTLNSGDGNSRGGSHLLAIPAEEGVMLSEALKKSPIVLGDGLSGSLRYGFGVDSNEDPELALALRISMHEQRQEQESHGQGTSAEVQAPPAAPEPSVLVRGPRAVPSIRVQRNCRIEDFSEALSSSSFLQSVLRALPGVGPESDPVLAELLLTTETEQLESVEEEDENPEMHDDATENGSVQEN